MTMMLISMLLLLSLIAIIDKVEGSRITDCTGYKHEPSLYMQICCNSTNLGQTIRMRKGIRKTIIICPNVRAQACPQI
uniref:Secreted protein n=1 Tax=Amphimedon queenslandica TaxID=400682 RepID=A0A1X7V3N2_AMPQE